MLQAHPTLRSVPILVLTADDTIPNRHRALAGGAQDFLIKPLDKVEVLLRIDNLLETRFRNALLQEKVLGPVIFCVRNSRRRLWLYGDC